ncbi:MAG: hypothetical protein ACRENP_30070, partial [Longimicrobiales bacterium]
RPLVCGGRMFVRGRGPLRALAELAEECLDGGAQALRPDRHGIRPFLLSGGETRRVLTHSKIERSFYEQ